jgi:hypothetical protein
MVYFQTKNINLGKIRRALEWKMLSYFMTIWNILLQFCILYSRVVEFVGSYLVYFCRFGMLGPRKIWQPCSCLQKFEGTLLLENSIFSMPVATAATTTTTFSRTNDTTNVRNFLWKQTNADFFNFDPSPSSPIQLGNLIIEVWFRVQGAGYLYFNKST